MATRIFHSLTNQIVSRVCAGYISRNGWALEQHKNYRIGQLQQIKKLMEENEKRIYEALWTDLHKVRTHPQQDATRTVTNDSLSCS